MPARLGARSGRGARFLLLRLGLFGKQGANVRQACHYSTHPGEKDEACEAAREERPAGPSRLRRVNIPAEAGAADYKAGNDSESQEQHRSRVQPCRCTGACRVTLGNAAHDLPPIRRQPAGMV